MLNLRFLAVLMIATAMLRSFAAAQDRSQREYTFAGVASEADCSALPALLFDIAPSGDRGETKDHLTVRCVPGKEDGPGLLSLTFTIVGGVNGNHGDPRQYTFRWGKSIDSKVPAWVGQFTKNPKLCTAFADLFNSKVSKTIASSSGSISTSPQWSVGCWGDDFWGTSMEVVFTGKIGESL